MTRGDVSAPLEDYALIGDCQTAALVRRDGSIDWLCWPDFSSTSCFGRLLGDDDNGFWRLGPAGEITATHRRYEAHSLILETTFETPDGTVQLLDFMPLRGENSDVVRLVRGIRGRVPMRMELVVRFSYGSLVPWVRHEESGWTAVGGPDLVVLRTPVPLTSEDLRTHAEFTVGPDECVPFVLTYGASHLETPRPIDPDAALAETRDFWTRWVENCSYQGRYRPAVERSLITLKALTFLPTGGIVAAPTTSLPEQLGGPRNWDYRYCWLRDATFTLLALVNGGRHAEARDWLRLAPARRGRQRPIRCRSCTTFGGERHVPEWTVDWLSGYAGSTPVRIGNAAAGQLQLDIYGEVTDAFYHALARTGRFARTGLCADLRAGRPLGAGLAGARRGHLGDPRRAAALHALPGHGVGGVRPRDPYRDPTGHRRRRLTGGVSFVTPSMPRCASAATSRRRGTFIQAYDTDALDASLLLMPLVGFLPHDDERVRRTVEAIQRNLSRDGLILRYDTSASDDGLPGAEGAFIACSCWMASDLAFMGRLDDATALFERVLGLANDVGLLAEEYDTAEGRLCGNFPQALSHIALTNTAFDLEHCREPSRDGTPRAPAAR